MTCWECGADLFGKNPVTGNFYVARRKTGLPHAFCSMTCAKNWGGPDATITSALDITSSADIASKPDAVNHPSHYADGWSNGAEVIDITEHLNFCRGNAIKYIARAGKKDAAKELEDLRKAAWYIAREIARLENN